MSMFPVFLIVIIAVVVISLLVNQHNRQQRRQSMSAFAAARGWKLEERRPELARRVGLARPSHGDNVIEGVVDGYPFVAFDHVRYENSGENQRTIPTSVVVVNLGVQVPELEMTRQGAISRFFTDLFGTDHLVGDKVFDDAVRIRTNSASFTAEVLTLPMKQLLLSRLHRSWRFTGDNLLTVTDGQHTPAELDEALATCRQVVSLIPPNVWARLQATGAPADLPVPVQDAPPPPATTGVPEASPAAAPQTPQAPQPEPPAPAAPPTSGGLLEESIGWSIDPITGKRTNR